MLLVQVEDALLDTYDLVYDRAVRNLSGTPRQQLVAIQDMVSMWGGGLPLARLAPEHSASPGGLQPRKWV